MYKRTSKSYDQILEEKGFTPKEIYSLDLTHRAVYSKLQSRISSRAFGDVLDIGAGRDLFRGMAGSAVKRWVSMDYDLRAASIDVQADAHFLPFVVGSFDCVVCADVLEHLHDPEKVLKQIRDVLRHGGILIVSVPFFLNLHEEPYDFFRFTIYGLKAICERNGFQVIEIERTCGLFGTSGYWMTAALTKAFSFSRVALRALLFCNRLFQQSVLAWLDKGFDKRGRFSQGHLAVLKKA